MPEQISGTWRTELTASDRVELRLNEDRYGISRGPNAVSGGVAVRGDEISFFASTACDGVGTYQWEVSHESLTFMPIEPDPCPGRADVLDGITYTR